MSRYFLLNENSITDTLSPDIRKVEKRVRPKPYTEYYFVWHGLALHHITTYSRAGERTIIDIAKARNNGTTLEAICRAFNIPPEWCTANYQP